MGTGDNNAWGKPCVGQESHPGEEPIRFMLQKMGHLTLPLDLYVRVGVNNTRRFVNGCHVLFVYDWNVVRKVYYHSGTALNKIGDSLLYGSILAVTTPPPGNPRDKVGPSGPGVGKFSSGVVPE